MEELTSLLQVIGSPAYFFDTASHKLLAVNQSFESLMEYDADALLEMTVADLRPPEDLPKLARALASQPPEGSAEWRYRTRAGQILYVRLSYRNSLYVDKKLGRRHDVRLVVISNWDTTPLRTADELFG